MSRRHRYPFRSRLVHRILEHALRERALPHVHGRLVDIGCGSKPFAHVFEGEVTDYVGIDHAQSPHGLGSADRTGSAYALPAADGEFDCALSTAVLEHLEEPRDALRECHRVLRPGGVAIYSVPLIWHPHEEPRDFFRYTRHGLEYLFRAEGFEVVEIHPLSGFLVTFSQMAIYWLYTFNRGVVRWLGIVPALAWLLQAFASLAHRIDRSHQWTWMYLAIVRKPGRP